MEKDAISNHLYRCVLGLDTRKGFSSIRRGTSIIVFVWEMNDHAPIIVLEAINVKFFNHTLTRETQHFIAKVRVLASGFVIEGCQGGEGRNGGKTAFMMVYCILQHFRPGKEMDPI